MHGNDQPIKIIIHLPESEVHAKTATELAEAFAHYFGYQADLLQQDLDELFSNGRRFLVIGSTILVTCLVLSQVAGRYLAEGPFRRLLEQALPIMGWVANWRPLEIFLYDWWPLARRRDLYRRLATASVETKSAAVPEIGVEQGSAVPPTVGSKNTPETKNKAGTQFRRLPSSPSPLACLHLSLPIPRHIGLAASSISGRRENSASPLSTSECRDIPGGFAMLKVCGGDTLAGGRFRLSRRWCRSMLFS